jgi:ketosteroid isomerase-like protein
MNIRRCSVSALSALALSVLLVAASPKGKDPDFKALQAEVDRAWCSLSAKNADPYYARDAELTFFDIAPLKYQSWAEYRDGAQRLFLDGCKSMKFIPKGDDHVVRKGDVAWLTRTLKITAEMKEGKPLDLDCRDTVVWVRYGDNWLIAHEHVSVPLPA